MRFPSFYLNAPPWTHLGCPSTDPKAKAVTWTTFNPPVNVVKILRGGASYRLSRPEGYFALANQQSIESNFIRKNGKNKVTVYCLWFGCRLPSHEPLEFSIEDEDLCEFIKAYKYRIVTNVSRLDRISKKLS